MEPDYTPALPAIATMRFITKSTAAANGIESVTIGDASLMFVGGQLVAVTGPGPHGCGWIRCRSETAPINQRKHAVIYQWPAHDSDTVQAAAVTVLAEATRRQIERDAAGPDRTAHLATG